MFSFLHWMKFFFKFLSKEDPSSGVISIAERFNEPSLLKLSEFGLSPKDLFAFDYYVSSWIIFYDFYNCYNFSSNSFIRFANSNYFMFVLSASSDSSDKFSEIYTDPPLLCF